MLREVDREVDGLARATYRVLPKSTLSFSKSVQALHLLTYAAHQLCDLLGCASNTGYPLFQSSIPNLAGRYAIAKFELLDR